MKTQKTYKHAVPASELKVKHTAPVQKLRRQSVSSIIDGLDDEFSQYDERRDIGFEVRYGSFSSAGY